MDCGTLWIRGLGTKEKAKELNIEYRILNVESKFDNLIGEIMGTNGQGQFYKRQSEAIHSFDIRYSLFDIRYSYYSELNVD